MEDKDRHRWNRSTWVAIAIVLPILYVLSIGPVVAILSPLDAPDWVLMPIGVFYFPLGLILQFFPDSFLSSLLDNYMQLFERDP